MINPMNRSTPIRMMGMASGMDTDFIIQNAMRAHQFRIDQRIRQRTLVQWRQETHNSIRDQLREFQSNLLSMTSQNSIFRSNNWNTHVASLTNATGGALSGAARGAVSISTRASSTVGRFDILSVNSLARGASITSGGRVSASNAAFSVNTRLEDLRFFNGVTNGVPNTPGQLQFESIDRIMFGDPEGSQTVIERTPVTGGEGFDAWEFTVEGATDSLNFTAHAFLAGGVANVNIDGQVVQVTRLADGNLARVNENATGSPIGNGSQLAIGHGDDQVTVTITRGENDGPWGWSIPGAAEGDEPITGTLNISEGGSVNLVASINARLAELTAAGQPSRGSLAVSAGSPVLAMDSEGNITTSSFAVQAGSIEWGTTITPVEINGQEIRLDRSMTINDMLNTINNAGLGITMSYDQMTDRFTVVHDDIDSTAGDIDITGLDVLFGGRGVGDAVAGPARENGSESYVVIRTANNEVVRLSGGQTNTIDFGGVTITLNHTFDAATDGAITVNVDRNVDQVMENITDFINSYNAIISRIEGLLRERRTPAERSYMPLTDEEKQHMTERQIEQWEEIARRGLMRNDNALEQLARELRSSFFSEIEGMGIRPSDIGLSTGNFFDGTGGQIFIDQDRLRAAIEANPDRVMEVFTRQGETRGEQGLASRINSIINDFARANGTQSHTLRGLERSIRNLNDQIERMTTRMFAEEDRLFRQFAAMERAMSQLQQQGDWFNAMLGSMG